MVSDMNIISTSQSQTTTTDAPKQDNKTDSNEFADALNKTTEIKKEKDLKDENKNIGNDKKNNENTTNNSNNSKEPPINPITTKSNAKNTESQLVKALKNKETDIENDKDIKNNKEEKSPINDKKDSKNKPINDKNNLDSKTIESKDANNANTTSNISPLTNNTNNQEDDNITNDIKNNKELDSKDKISNNTKDSKNEKLQETNIKTLNDVKKEAQARNLNLQKMEILENGKKNKIDPKDLMDMNVLENNKEKLNHSLQDKASYVATSLARIKSDDLGEMSKKDTLLAELLNRYDANANAKRKAQNEMEKLQFKMNDGDKSMIIERTYMQPKNITESKFRNEVMEQEFLEQLHDITGDESLGDLIEVNKTKIKTHLMMQNNKVNLPQDTMQKTYQGWSQQGQFLGPKELKDPNNTLFEMDVQKPFDALFSENLKLDKNAKESDTLLKNEKKVEDKQKEKVDSKQEVSSTHTKQEVSMKNAIAREAMKNFTSQFKNEILNYKPPITKINLELNPANLGQVAMTISKKGKDLQVSITSNANVMTMFVQNAQELRQNLMQIGFNNLDLNFGTHEGQSSNKQQDNNEGQKGNNVKLQTIEEAETQVQLGNIPQSVEIALPQYA